MKPVYKICMSLIMCSLISQAAFAGCLDSTPTKRVQWEQQFRALRAKQTMVVERQALYQELAREAGLTSSRSKIIITASTAPFLLWVGALTVSGVFQHESMLGLLFGSLSAAVGSSELGIVYQNLKQSGYSEEEITLLKEIHQKSLAEKNLVCSYSNLQQKILLEQERILNEELSGTIFNRLGNILTLGSAQKNALLNILALTSIQRDLFEAELTELLLVQFSS